MKSYLSLETDYCVCIKVVLQSDAELASPGAGAGGRGEVWLQPPPRPHGLRSLAQGRRHCRPQGDMTGHDMT